MLKLAPRRPAAAAGGSRGGMIRARFHLHPASRPGDAVVAVAQEYVKQRGEIDTFASSCTPTTW